MRITPGTMIVAIFAVLFGLVGAYAVRRYLQPPVEAAAPQDRQIRVPLASTDIPAGRAVTFGDIMIVPMTMKQIRERGFPPEFMASSAQIMGRVVRENMKKGEAFTTEGMYPEGMGPSVAERLQPGLRAVTVSINGTGAMAGLASPGSIVDVLFRVSAKEDSDIPEATITLLEAVEVLALGQNSLPGSKAVKAVETVTLAVTSQQANALKIVEGRGEFSLALRNPGDDSLSVGSGPQTIESLFNFPEKQKPFTTEIYRQGVRQTITFDRGYVVRESLGGFPVGRMPPKVQPSTDQVTKDASAPATVPDSTRQ